MRPSDFPEFIAAHTAGNRSAVLRRCPGESCYTDYAECADRATAKDLAHRLNSTSDGKR